MDEKGQAPWWQPGMLTFARLSGWIGGPVIVAVFLGKWLDEKYDTDPWLFLLSVGVAFAVSMFGIVKDALREMKRIEAEERAKKNAEAKK
jgi:F0F1-type ATP synthase assembly protein I